MALLGLLLPFLQPIHTVIGKQSVRPSLYLPCSPAHSPARYNGLKTPCILPSSGGEGPRLGPEILAAALKPWLAFG